MEEHQSEGCPRKTLEGIQQCLGCRPDVGLAGGAEVVVLRRGEVIQADVHERGVDGAALV